jgi:hypothetical protein
VAAVAELHGIELVANDNRPGLRMTMAFVAPRPESTEASVRSRLPLSERKQRRVVAADEHSVPLVE